MTSLKKLKIDLYHRLEVKQQLGLTQIEKELLNLLREDLKHGHQ